MLCYLVRGKGFVIPTPGISPDAVNGFLATIEKMHLLNARGSAQFANDVTAVLAQLPQADVQTLLWLTGVLQVGVTGADAQSTSKAIKGISPVKPKVEIEATDNEEPVQPEELEDFQV